MTLTEFYQRYISFNLSDYENIDVDLRINLLILAFAVGIIIATLLLGFYRSSVQQIIKQLTRHEANDAASAKTLDEISLGGWKYIFALKNIPILRKLVSRIDEIAPTVTEESNLADDATEKTEGDKPIKEECNKDISPTIDYSRSKLYLVKEEEEKIKKVLQSYESSLMSSTLFSALILAIAVCTIFCTPTIFDFIDGILGLI